MGIGKWKSKNAAKGKTSKAAFLKVNKYENADMALNLIAHICTSDTDLSVEDDFKAYKQHVDSMRDRFLEKAGINVDKGDESVDRLALLQKACLLPFNELPDEMESTNGNFSQTIAVCGGYSSGKSSFLNNLLETKNALPTGIEPVSMINTYINCPQNARQLTVKGRNIKGNLVLLNREVLDCIQHSSKNKVFVGSVLDTLYIDLPLPAGKEYLKGLTFIDTPGYNNSQNANQENNLRDYDTALKAMRDADAIIWCVDINNGTIPKSDIDMLNRVAASGKDCPLVIVFTRLDKKRDQAMNIMKDAEKTCKRSLKLSPVDILAYSSTDGSVVSLLASKYRKKDIEPSALLGSTFSLLKKNGLQPYGVEYWTRKVQSCFQQEMDACNERIGDLEQYRLQLADEKDKAYRNGEEQTKNISFMATLKDVLVDSYSNLFNDRKRLVDWFIEACDGWANALNREQELFENSNGFSKKSYLKGLYNKDFEKQNQLCDKFNNTHPTKEWSPDDRKQLLGKIEQSLKDSGYEIPLEQQYKDVVDLKKAFRTYMQFLKEESIKTTQLLNSCAQKAFDDIDKRLRKMQEVKEEHDTDVFSAIAGDNMPRFLACFSDGVKLTECNEQGFSPITFAARCSNNAMVKFFIMHVHVGDLSIKDQRGYNALETAAIYHCQDICELIAKAAPDLVYQSQPLDKLADNTKFIDWISNL